jgi:hypothetical protein
MKTMGTIVVMILAFAPAAFLPLRAGAQDATEIIRRVDEKGWSESSETEMSMIVYPDSRDEGNHRDMTVLAYGRGEDDSYMEFLSPRSIKGLKLLSLGDDQWVYFASTGRRRKIAQSSESKKESVRGVGGDFSYEDLGGGSWEEKYSFAIRDSSRDGWVLEGRSLKQDAVYERVVVHVDKDYLVSQVEYYTEEEGHYKDLALEEVRKIGGRDVATRMTMINHDERSKTVILIHDARFDTAIDQKYFDPARFYR